MILIAGADVRASDEAAVSLFQAGHVPIMAEWLAFPLLAVGRSAPRRGADAGDVLHPIAERLLDRCDAVLRLKGVSMEADYVVALARTRGMRVYFSLQEALDS